MQDRVISKKFLTHRVSAQSTDNFPPTIAISNFCLKRKKNAFISETVRDRAISTNFTCRLSPGSTGDYPKIILPPFLVAILNFCVKRKNTSQTVRDRAILTKNLQGMCSLVATFPQNRFPAICGGHFEFLRKTQKHVYLKVYRRVFPKMGFPPFLTSILNFCLKGKRHYLEMVVE